MKKTVEHVVTGRVHGVFVLGSCGEFACFDFEESKEIIQETIKIVNKRVPVFVGVGRCSTKETLKIAEMAKEEGADYIVVLPPFYFKDMPGSELEKHFTKLNELGIPIVLYNSPSFAKEISPELIVNLAKLKNIIALKDSSGNLDYFKETAKIIPSYQGDDSLIFKSLEAGGVGCVPGLGNVFPELFVRLMETYERDKKEAERIQRVVNKAYDIIYKKANDPRVGVKIALECLGICSSKMREPNGQADLNAKRIISEFIMNYKNGI